MTKRRFFAAANTEDGFVSLFETVFPARELDRLYLLKGGPGTGKSTLLRALGEAAEKRGIPAEYYYCSSDPSSLDGVKFPTVGAAVVDATLPHAVEPRLPGVCEKIVDLSEAFRLSELREHRAEAIALATEKTLYYESAYRFLHAAGILSRELDALLAPAWLGEKADAAIRRMLRGYGIVPSERTKGKNAPTVSCRNKENIVKSCRKAEGGADRGNKKDEDSRFLSPKPSASISPETMPRISPERSEDFNASEASDFIVSEANPYEGGVRYTDAIGTSGAVHLDTWEREAEHVVSVTDRYGTGRAFLARMADLCDWAGIPVWRAPDVVRRDRVIALYFPGVRVLFSVLAEGEKTVNVRRFLDDSVLISARIRGNFVERCRKEMLDGALSSLADVGKCHAALEAVYGAHVDFAAVDAIRDKLTAELFGEKTEKFSK